MNKILKNHYSIFMVKKEIISFEKNLYTKSADVTWSPRVDYYRTIINNSIIVLFDHVPDNHTK